MKTTFIEVSNALQALNIFKTIDADYGQLDNYESRPAVAFPCALIKVSIIGNEDIGGGDKMPVVEIVVRLGFNPLANRTGATVDEPIRAKSLEFYDTEELVFNTMNDLQVDHLTVLENLTRLDEERADNYKVFRQTYRTEILP